MNLIKLNIIGLSYSQFKEGAYALFLEEDNGLRKLSIVIGGINNVYFNKFHEFLLSSKKSEKEIKQFIKKLSLDYEKLTIESESKSVAGIINKNLEWAKLFKIRGTPAFIVKGELINGFVGSSILESLLFD